MLQAERPDDYVIATGETHSVREMLELPSTASSSIGRTTSRLTRNTIVPRKWIC